MRATRRPAARGWHRRPWLIPLGIFLLTCLHPLGLRCNGGSLSQPKGLYWLVPGEPARNHLVLVKLPAQIARSGWERGYLRHVELAKCVAALPGDTVEVTPDGLWINGSLLQHTRPQFTDSKDRPVDSFPFRTYDTLPGSLWLYSNFIPNSWDSRYFGPVPLDTVRGRLVPVLTWPSFRRGPGGHPCNWHPINS